MSPTLTVVRGGRDLTPTDEDRTAWAAFHDGLTQALAVPGITDEARGRFLRMSERSARLAGRRHLDALDANWEG